VPGWVVRSDAPVCMRERGGWGQGGSGGGWGRKGITVLPGTSVCGTLLLFIIRVKRELTERVYRNGCRYNEPRRLNVETGGSKTPRTHWVARVNM
jgi:hypothetical protein